MGYGVTEAGIVAVGKAMLNVPLLPIVAVCVVPLMVMETISPDAGNVVPLPMVPPTVTEVAPKRIDGEGVNPLNTAGTACTVTAPMERICWVPTTRVAVFE